MRDPSSLNGRRTLAVIIIAATMVVLCLPALAVEDGLGTNVVKNLRVKDGGTLSLGGTAITNWVTLQNNATDQTARDLAATATNAAAIADAKATNALAQAATADGKAVTADGKADDAQADATQALTDAATADGKAVTADAKATNALAQAATADGKAVTADGKAVTADAKATNALAQAATADGKAVTAQSTATYASNRADTAHAEATNGIAKADTAQGAAEAAQSAAEAAQADASAATNGLTLKYDKTGGAISGNVTFGSNTVYTIPALVTPLDNASISPANRSMIKIAGSGGAVTNVGIAAGEVGQMLTLIGTDATKTVQICAASANVVLTEGVDFTMGSNAVLQVIYTGDKWAETHRATP